MYNFITQFIQNAFIMRSNDNGAITSISYF